MSTITKRVTMFAPLVMMLVLAFSATAQAQRFRGGFGFWRPYYSYGIYPYVVGPPTATVRVDAVPKQAEVYVDGYLAGTAGKVHTTPGGHAITLYLPGYRTVTKNIYVAPDSTFKMQDTMDRLAAGEVSALPPIPVPRTRRPAAQG